MKEIFMRVLRISGPTIPVKMISFLMKMNIRIEAVPLRSASI
jgi:hypothetical protein